MIDHDHVGSLSVSPSCIRGFLDCSFCMKPPLGAYSMRDGSLTKMSEKLPLDFSLIPVVCTFVLSSNMGELTEIFQEGLDA